MDTLAAFTAHFGIRRVDSRRRMLDEVAAAFAGIPYENITKIIKRAECGSAEKARRYPEEVIGDHISWGAGGTCFSLTSALRQLVRSMGWKAEYILADRRYGQDTHCALLLWIDEVPHLLDPGFLIVKPIPIADAAEREVETGFNRLILAPEGRNNGISLSTVRGGSRTYRLTYKTAPVDEGEFLSAWDASFDWDMMRYPLLAHSAAYGQIYLRGSRLQISKADSVERREVAGADLIDTISAEFRIHQSVVAHAISILKQRGESGGRSSIR